jgi:hypothetical protein
VDALVITDVTIGHWMRTELDRYKDDMLEKIQHSILEDDQHKRTEVVSALETYISQSALELSGKELLRFDTFREHTTNQHKRESMAIVGKLDKYGTYVNFSVHASHLHSRLNLCSKYVAELAYRTLAKQTTCSHCGQGSPRIAIVQSYAVLRGVEFTQPNLGRDCEEPMVCRRCWHNLSFREIERRKRLLLLSDKQSRYSLTQLRALARKRAKIPLCPRAVPGVVRLTGDGDMLEYELRFKDKDELQFPDNPRPSDFQLGLSKYIKDRLNNV